MRNKSDVVVNVATCCILWLCVMHTPLTSSLSSSSTASSSSSSHMHVNAVSVTKGLPLRHRVRVRAPKIADFAKVNGPDATTLQPQSQSQQLPMRTLQPQSQQQQQQDYNTTTLAAANTHETADSGNGNGNGNGGGGKYEIRSVSGEPSYKSVNLTWEVEFVPSADANTKPKYETSGNASATELPELQPPRAFQVYFCEIQAFGPHRCRFKTVDGNGNGTDTSSDTGTHHHMAAVSDDADVDAVAAAAADADDGNIHRQVRHYAMQIDNLRMATTYSFHIRPVASSASSDNKQQQQQQQAQQPQKRRSMRRHGGNGGGALLPVVDGNELDNEVLSSSSNAGTGNGNELNGQTIVIPTKGFTAEATKCLPHASEIEVQTGPYFGGKIVVDGGNCGVKGNPDDATDTYTMRIDHKMCGSLVKPETNTVETFITVQENLGIYTHSTRRFVVVCSFQSGMQTVRASFTVPGRGSVATPVENDPFIPDDRSGRELSSSGMRFVDKSALVLKEDFEGEAAFGGSRDSSTASTSEEMEALVHEIPASLPPLMPPPPPPTQAMTPNATAFATPQRDVPNSVALLETIQPNVNEWHIKHENDVNKPEHTVDNDDDNDGADDNNNNIAADAQSMPQANYAKLVLDRAAYGSDANAWYRTHTRTPITTNSDTDTGTHGASDNNSEGRAFHLSTLHYITAHMGNVLLAACASVIIFVVFIVLVVREARRQRREQLQQQLQQQQQQKYDM